MKKIKAVAFAVAVTSCVLASIAYASTPNRALNCPGAQRSMSFGHHQEYDDMESRINRMTESLHLTKEQRDSLRAVADKVRPEMRELHDRLVDSRKQMHELMHQDSPNEKDLRKLADIQAHAIADMIVMHTKIRSEMYAVLTSEQREQLQHRYNKGHDRSASGNADEPKNMSNTESFSYPMSAATAVMM